MNPRYEGAWQHAGTIPVYSVDPSIAVPQIWDEFKHILCKSASAAFGNTYAQSMGGRNIVKAAWTVMRNGPFLTFTNDPLHQFSEKDEHFLEF